MIALVTGGRGFIGSHFVEQCLLRNWKVIDIDCMTYASHKDLPWDNNPHYSLITKKIQDLESIPFCDVLFNFAAESHVDSSITSPTQFLDSNTYGVFNLLELIRGKPKYNRPLFFQISTDEVYGDTLQGCFKETDALNPGNPYAASKASAEMLIKSYHKTYGLEYLITRCTNNYGDRQYREKLIPKILYCLKNNKPIPLHGDGSYVRDWIYVKDHIKAIMFLIDKQKNNETFNVCGNAPFTNLQIVDTVLGWEKTDKENAYRFVENRWGQDVRYSICDNKMKNLGCYPDYEGLLYKWY